MPSKTSTRFIAACVMCASCFSSGFAASRWSSLHITPDADFIESWNYILEYQGYYWGNQTRTAVFKNTGTVSFAFSEWALFKLGYANGAALGLKAKVLGETVSWVPSLAVGVTNIFHHMEDYYYDHEREVWKNEFYLVAGKGIEPLKLRLHAGASTMPGVSKEAVDFFFAIEKYLGGSAYITNENFFRDGKIRPSLFASARFFQKHCELSVGAVDLIGMFMNDKNKYAFSFNSIQSSGLVRPGVWIGLRVLGAFGSSGRNGGFGSLEDQINYQREMLKMLRYDIDSLKRVMAGFNCRIDSVSTSLRLAADSALGVSSGMKLRDFALERLIKLNSLYSQENLDAGKIKEVAGEVSSYGENMVPILKEIALDNKLERKVHVQAITMLKLIGTKSAGGAVCDVLAQTQDPDVKVEGLIALGDLKYRDAALLVEQLSRDPNDAVAFAATEVFKKLEHRAPQPKEPAHRAPLLPGKIPESTIAVDADTLSAAKPAAAPALGKKAALQDSVAATPKRPVPAVQPKYPVRPKTPPSPARGADSTKSRR